MDIVLDNAARIPFYQQIANQIRNQIMDGSLKSGEELLSIRQLAHELHISVITTKHAYTELSQHGFIVQIPGKGTFVADCSANVVREEQIRNLEKEVRKCSQKARALGLSHDEFLFMADLESPDETRLKDASNEKRASR